MWNRKRKLWNVLTHLRNSDHIWAPPTFSFSIPYCIFIHRLPILYIHTNTHTSNRRCQYKRNTHIQITPFYGRERAHLNNFGTNWKRVKTNTPHFIIATKYINRIRARIGSFSAELAPTKVSECRKTSAAPVWKRDKDKRLCDSVYMCVCLCVIESVCLYAANIR